MTERPQTPETIQLPSGRTLEIVNPDNGPAFTRVKAQPATRDLAVCERCASHLVEPLDWAEAGTPGLWRVSVRCPECEHRAEGVFPQEVVDRFDETLDDATGAIIFDLKRLERASMEADVEGFARALAADAILPEDFAP